MDCNTTTTTTTTTSRSSSRTTAGSASCSSSGRSGMRADARTAPASAHAKTLPLGLVLALALCGACARAAVLTSGRLSAASEQLDGAAAQRQPAAAAPAALLARFRRHAGAGAPSPALKQLLEGDEQVLRRQLPDLLAQAHQDKAVERALLRMLISASQRASMAAASAGPQQAAAAAMQPTGSGGNNNNNNNWQLDTDNSLGQYAGDELSAARAARLEQANSAPGPQSTSELANLDAADLSSLTASIAQLNGQLQPLIEQQREIQRMDKREYIKPCSFNAISCVRRPFGVNRKK